MATNGLWTKIGVLLAGITLTLGLLASPLSLEQKEISIIFVLLAIIILYFDQRIRKLEPREADMEKKMFEKLTNIEAILKSKKGKLEFDPVVVGIIVIALLALLYLFWISPK